MNKDTIELLAKHSETAFAAPNGIKKMRELILTLAMQGRLVPQYPNDQPASELLKEIEAEKHRLVQEGKIKKPKPLPPILEKEKPYALPKGWEWVRFPDCYFVIGSKINQIQTSEYQKTGKFPVIDQGNTFIAGYTNDKERLLKTDKTIIVFGDHTKNIKFIDFDFVIGADGVKVLRPYDKVQTGFLFRLMQSFRLTDRGYARHFKVLNAQLVPLPPFEEQHRIIAKIDELMARCDELEKLQAAQQEKRLTVHAATIKQLLNIAKPDQHEYAFNFLSEHFGELYTVKENVAELRKAILQLAVMGKLVPQSPNDQPASELLKEIEAERQRLVKEGKIKKAKPLPPILEKEKPYVLPKGWEWVHVIDIVDVGTGSTPITTNRNYYDGDIPWYTSSATNKLFADKPARFITEKAITETNCKIFPSGSLIIALYGQGKTRGQISELTIAGATNQAIAAMVFFDSSIGVKKYLKYFFIKIYEEIRKMAEGAAQPNLNVGKVKDALIPLPPLSEQSRIVEKIDELMALCDSLEQQIDATTNKQSELLNVLMHAQSQSNTKHHNQSTSCSKAQILDLATYRASIGGYAFNKLANAQYFGRTAAAKVMYMAQAHVGLELNLRPERQAAGPLDTWIYDFERQGQNNQWFEVNEKALKNGKQKTEYRCLPGLSELVATAEKLMSPQQQSEFDRLIYTLADKKTEEVEVIATLFAVWNDFLIDGIQPSDEQIIADFRENWHERKARFTTEELGRWLNWLRRENIIPQGLPPRTVQQPNLLDH